jgi:DNA sulfur modification protein DndC
MTGQDGLADLYAPASVSEQTRNRINTIIEVLAERYQDSTDSRPWVVAFSGSKDSTLVAHLVFAAVLRVRPSRRTRPVHVVCSDTQVETPAVAEFAATQQAKIQQGSDWRDGFPCPHPHGSA